jgi:predicted phage terminase large subunit-like protein
VISSPLDLRPARSRRKKAKSKDPDSWYEFVSELSDVETLELFYDWETWARPNQLIPLDDDSWTNWLILAGRGWGKTRCGAEFVRYYVENGLASRVALVAEDAGDARDVMIEGESGILAISHPKCKPLFVPSKRRLEWPNGAIATIYSDNDPETLRGPQHDLYWCDELAKFRNAEAMWSNLMFGLRLGQRPRGVVTTTPKPIPIVRKLLEDPRTYVTTGTTHENFSNLAPSFKDEIIAQYEGTRLGRQELYAEVIDPEDYGIVRRPWFKLWGAEKPLPEFLYIVQSYDCAYTEKTQNDPTACSVWGVFRPNDDSALCAMLIDCWEDFLAYPDLRTKIMDEYTVSYGEPGKRVDLVLVEDKASGISIIQDLQRAGIPVRGYNPGRADKVQRLHLVANIIAHGRVYIPESMVHAGQPRDWAEPLVSQICSFPESQRDDLTDTVTQALRILKDMRFLDIDPVAPDTEFADDEYKPRRVNPYAV